MKTFINSPVGYLVIEEGNIGIKRVYFTGNIKPNFSKDNSRLLSECVRQLKDYFSGKLQIFHIPLELNGTEFERNVWLNTIKIPYSTTLIYSELARRINNPKAYRAVGNALGKNPIPIIIPCHRVVSKNGLGGFSAPFHIKSFLINLEKKIVDNNNI